MRALIIYFSRSGNTERIGEELAGVLDADIEKIEDQKERRGILGWIESGRDSIKKRTTSIKKLEHKPQSYDVTIVGTPVWAGDLTPAIRTFLKKYHRKIDNVAFFSTSKSGETSKIYDTMKKTVDIEPISTLTITEKEIKKRNYEKKMDEFIEELKEYID
ncbi:MAG: flavodoxin family protein [Thermoplasmatota archaeon]